MIDLPTSSEKNIPNGKYIAWQEGAEIPIRSCVFWSFARKIAISLILWFCATASTISITWFQRSSYFINTWIHAIMPEQSGYVKNYYTYLQQAYSNAIWKTQTDSLKALSQYLEKQGGQFLAVTFPFLNSPWKDYRFGFVHQEMDSLWKSEGIAHLDLLPLYRRYPAENLVVNSLDAHPNEFADSLAASSIATFLETHLKKK